MATISLYASKINQMPELIKNAKKAVNDFKEELTSLSKAANKVDSGICDLSDVISEIQASTKTQESRFEALEIFRSNIDDFVSDTVSIDGKVAETVNKNKKDFYDEYSYLKPDCEKSGWEKFCDTMKAVGDWCKEHWESIVSLIAVIVIAVAVIALCVVTFGGAAVLAAAIVGAIVGFAGQLISDVISWLVTGEWTGTLQSYIGATLGGIVGGVLTLTGNYALASAVESGLTTFIGQHLENLTGGEQRSSWEILFNTSVDASIAALFSKGFDALSSKFSKMLSKNFSQIHFFRRLAGAGNYDASFRMVLTKLSRGQIKNFSIKTIRNGVVGGLAGSLFENLFDGFFGNPLDWMKNRVFTLLEDGG